MLLTNFKFYAIIKTAQKGGIMKNKILIFFSFILICSVLIGIFSSWMEGLLFILILVGLPVVVGGLGWIIIDGLPRIIKIIRKKNLSSILFSICVLIFLLGVTFLTLWMLGFYYGTGESEIEKVSRSHLIIIAIVTLGAGFLASLLEKK